MDFTLLKSLAEYRKESAATYRRRYEATEHPTPEELDDDFLEIDSLVRRIRRRGGDVVFVRMPSSGERLQIEEEFHPRVTYWDRFVTSSSAKCIHWADLKFDRELSCPDDSHLDCRDTVRFTDALADELVDRKIVAPHPRFQN